MDMTDFIIAASIPSAITGFVAWWIKRVIDKRYEYMERKEEQLEKMMIMIMKNSSSTNILARATAKAVQRIPDAKCNGDMTSALENADNIQKEGDSYLMELGVQKVFSKS